MKDFIRLLTFLDFPEPARDALCRAREQVHTSDEYVKYICHCCDVYRLNGTLDYERHAARAAGLAEAAGVDGKIGTLLFFLALCPDAYAFYQAEGRETGLYRASFSDLTMKCVECYKVYGVWGLSTAWFGRFFDRTRFLLGRLEFEDDTLRCDFGAHRKGESAINVHIPECGPLDHDACKASYALAVQAFPKCVREGKAVFVCSSWLLAAELSTFLPPNSNILRFAADYQILRVREEQGFPDGWRVFADRWQSPPEQLPRDTALQRGYADRLSTCGTTTVAYGAFEYKVL